MLVKNISSVLLFTVGLTSLVSAGVIEGGLTARALEARKGGRFGGFGQNAGKQKANTGTTNKAASSASSDTSTAAAAVSTAAAVSSGNTASLALDAANVQSASDSTGQVGTPEAGQANSNTDAANFINFCTGKTLTNGLQVKSGSCNGIVMGDIPASNKMVSSMLINPLPGQNIAADTDFTIQVATANLAAGSFTNAAKTYYSAPQELDSTGQVIGHTHVTIQDMGTSLTPSQPLDAGVFSFFKGINDAGTNGVLSATVAGGLPAGNYRVCTMSSSSNHQPVLMPVAQRGAQDDCTKFTVGGAATDTTAANAVIATTASSVQEAATSAAAASTGTANNAGRKQRVKGGAAGAGRKQRGRV